MKTIRICWAFLIAFVTASCGDEAPTPVAYYTDETECSRMFVGAGTPEAPFLIRSAEDFALFVNPMHNPLYFQGGILWREPFCYKLTTDLVIERSWFPEILMFSGVFDGDNHTISGTLTANYNTSPDDYLSNDEDVYPVQHVGLFQVLIGTVKNLNMKCDIVLRASGLNIAYVGSVAAVCSQYGIIENCNNYGNISAPSVKESMYLGGITGISGILTNCRNYGTVHADGCPGEMAVGGIAGRGENRMRKCFNHGKVVRGGSAGTSYVGGLVGFVESAMQIHDSRNFGDVENGKADTLYTGGLVGWSNGQCSIYECCSNSGSVNGQDASRSPLVGNLSVELLPCDKGHR